MMLRSLASSWGWMICIIVACFILCLIFSFGTISSTRPYLLLLCSHEKYLNVQFSVLSLIQGYCALSSPSEFDVEEIYLLSFILSFILSSMHGRIYMIWLYYYRPTLLTISSVLCTVWMGVVVFVTLLTPSWWFVEAFLMLFLCYWLYFEHD